MRGLIAAAGGALAIGALDPDGDGVFFEEHFPGVTRHDLCNAAADDAAAAGLAFGRPLRAAIFSVMPLPAQVADHIIFLLVKVVMEHEAALAPAAGTDGHAAQNGDGNFGRTEAGLEIKRGQTQRAGEFVTVLKKYFHGVLAFGKLQRLDVAQVHGHVAKARLHLEIRGHGHADDARAVAQIQRQAQRLDHLGRRGGLGGNGRGP